MEKEYKNRTSYVASGIVWGMIQNVLNFSFSFVIRTIFIYKFSDEYLGLNSLCASILYALNIIDLGLDKALVYRLYKPMVDKDIKEVNRQMAFYRKVYFCIGTIVLLIGIICLVNINKFIAGSAPQDVNVYFVFSIYLLNTVLSYWIVGPKSFILLANQHSDRVNKVIAIDYIVLYFLQIISLYFRKYYLFLFAFLVATFVLCLLYNRQIEKILPEFKYEGKVSALFAKDLFKEAITVAVYKIRDVLRNALDSVVISGFLGLAILSKYQNYYAILIVPALLLKVITTSITPSLGNLNVTEDKHRVYYIYRVTWKFLLMITGVFCIVFLGNIQQAMYIWLGEDHLLSYNTAIAFAIYLYVLGASTYTTMIRESLGLWGSGKIGAGIETIVNIVLNLVLVNQFGCVGVIASTIISIIFINLPVDWKIILKYFGENYKYTLKELFKNIAWVIIAYFFLAVLDMLLPGYNIAVIVLRVVICTFISVILCSIFNMKDVEFKELIGIGKSLFFKNFKPKKK